MLIKRSIFNDLCNDQNQKFASILLGPRQVGKSTLLRQLEEHFQKNGLKTSFFDLEQPQDLIAFNKNDQEVIDLILRSGDVVFLDEFHYLKNASKIFKAIYDRNAHVKIYASGSSSIEVHKHLKESLAGRKRIYQIYPLTLEEHIASGLDLNAHLVYGGMPGLIHEKEEKGKRALLVEILKSYLLKDVKSLIREENVRAFNHMLYFIAEHQGSIISNASLASEIGLTVKAVSHYLSILQQTYVLHTLPSYSGNQSGELKKSQKFYLYDLGIRNSLLQDFSPIQDRRDSGAIMESFVLLSLIPRLNENVSLKFWRTRVGEEVDFIVVKDRKPFPVEVKANLKKPEIPSGLAKFLARYPLSQCAFVISNCSFAPVTIQGKVIHFKSFEDTPSLLEMI